MCWLKSPWSLEGFFLQQKQWKWEKWVRIQRKSFREEGRKLSWCRFVIFGPKRFKTKQKAKSLAQNLIKSEFLFLLFENLSFFWIINVQHYNMEESGPVPVLRRNQNLDQESKAFRGKLRFGGNLRQIGSVWTSGSKNKNVPLRNIQFASRSFRRRFSNISDLIQSLMWLKHKLWFDLRPFWVLIIQVLMISAVNWTTPAAGFGPELSGSDVQINKRLLDVSVKLLAWEANWRKNNLVGFTSGSSLVCFFRSLKCLGRGGLLTSACWMLTPLCD